MNRIKKLKNNIFMILLFAIISVVSAEIILRSGFIGGTDDVVFHWQRIIEIHNSWVHGNFIPRIALTKFDQSGSAVMSMYPYINLIPIVILTFFIKSFVLLMPIIFILRNFLSLMIGYYSCNHFCKNKYISFLFSLTYTLSTLVLHYAFRSMDMGVSSSEIFMPLVLFGFLELIHNNHWLEFSSGLTLIIFCHVVNTLIVFSLIFLLIIFNFKQLNKIKLILLVKSFSLTLLTTAVFWASLVFLELSNKIIPPHFVGIPLSGISFDSYFYNAVSTNAGCYMDFFALIGLLLSVLNYKKLDNYSVQMFWIAIMYIFVCSNFFPWSILNYTFIEPIIQFSYRLFVIPQMLLCFLFSKNILALSNNKHGKFIILIISSILVIFLQVVGQQKVVNKNINSPELRTFQKYERSQRKPFNRVPKYRVDNQRDFDVLVDSPKILYTDYWPKASISKFHEVEKSKATYNRILHVKVHPKGNGKFVFSAPCEIPKLQLPFLFYHGIHYQVRMDHKAVSYGNEHSYMCVRHVPKGKHILKISNHYGLVDYISFIMSITGIVIYLTLDIRAIKLHHNELN